MAPINAAAINPSVKTSVAAISSPMVRATATPNRNGPMNSPTVAIPSAVAGLKARDEIMVATMLLASRIPFRKSKIRARAITMMSSVGIGIMSLRGAAG